MRNKKIPNPGSKEAIAKGCACPVLDNNNGEGMNTGSTVLYYVARDCPIHCPKITRIFTTNEKRTT